MATKNAGVKLTGRFPAGSKIGLYESDSPNGDPVATATTDKFSVTEFKGLEDGLHYFAGAVIDGEWRSAAVTAKTDRVQGKPTSQPLPSPAPGGPDPSRQIITGPRGTGNVPAHTALDAGDFAGRSVGEKTPKGEQVDEPQPHARQEDASGPQRSDTFTGEATPKDPDEPVPAMRQEDVPKGTPQRSDTETGEATIKELDETPPSIKQEDVPKGTQQRSDTETGEAEPKPAVKGTDVRKRADSSQAKAKGQTRAKPREKTSKKGAKAAPKRGRTRSGRKRS